MSGFTARSPDQKLLSAFANPLPSPQQVKASPHLHVQGHPQSLVPHRMVHGGSPLHACNLPTTHTPC